MSAAEPTNGRAHAAGGNAFDLAWARAASAFAAVNVDALVEHALRAKAAKDGPEVVSGAWPTLQDRLLAAAARGPRHATGIAPLDDMTRGGLREGDVAVLGGAPGAGKSTLSAQIARHYARSGLAVLYLAIDEAPSGIDARNLQSIGVPRDVAEEPDAGTIERAAAELGPLPLEVVDGRTVEAAMREHAARHPDVPRAYILDSVQKVWTARSGDFKSPRERVDDVIVTAKAICRAPATKGILVLLSELGRVAYRTNQAPEEIDLLSAFKETGSLEYSMDLGVVLLSQKGEPDTVRAVIPKCRMGRKGEFGLLLDRARATFTATDAPSAATTDDAAIDALADVVIAWLRANPGSTTREVRAAVRGNDGRKLAALERLARHGALRDGRQKGDRGARWFPVAAQLAEDEL